MAVLKQTSPTAVPTAPRPNPSKTVPSASTSRAVALGSARRFRLVWRSSRVYIVADSAAVKEAGCGYTDHLRITGRDGDADLLCAGRPQPGLYSGVRGGLWIGLALRVSTGCLAVRRGGGDLGADCGPALAETDIGATDIAAVIVLDSIVTCPACGHRAVERMPENACNIRYTCKGCSIELAPHPGDCCVFCSYGSVPCPPIQRSTESKPPSELKQ